MPAPHGDLIQQARDAVAALTTSPARDVATKIDPATVDVEELARFLSEAFQHRTFHNHRMKWEDRLEFEQDMLRDCAREMVARLDDLEPILARLYVASGRF